MRERFSLDLKDLSRFTLLVHGGYGSGKTFFLGDALRYESGNGPVHFINIAGEDGYLSIANLGLGNTGETVDSLKDFKEVLVDAKAAKLRALAIDGGKHLGKLVIRHVCGDRLPTVGRNSDDWTKIHREFEDTFNSLRYVAPIVIMASSSDRSMDQVSGELSLTPDMPGRQAAGVGGMFDFVFVLKAESLGPDRVKRYIETAPKANTIIRQRLPKSLPGTIDLPEGGGGWKKLVDAMQMCLDSAPAGAIGAQKILAAQKTK
jgi:hypothetical protein